MADNKKTKNILKLMQKFLYQKEISSYDELILEEFNCSQKTLERYLKDIEDNFEHIIYIKRGKKSIWKLIRTSDIFEEFIKNSEDVTYFFHMANEYDPEILKEIESNTFKKLTNKDETIFLFKNYIMEEFKNNYLKQIFNSLKNAVKDKKYIDLKYIDNTPFQEHLKPIKLIFMDNNWYIVIVDIDDELQFKRVSFIKEIKIKKDSFKFEDLTIYYNFLKSVQNSLTLFNKSTKIATIKATPNIAKYFVNDMKKFLPSQKYLKTLSDQSVIFTLHYTQSLEILPLIQKWLPDLIILEPKELRDEYIQKLEKSIKRQNDN